jgi:drug/metabolite transporter (DMT)-like permease
MDTSSRAKRRTPPAVVPSKKPAFASASLFMILSVTLFTISHGIVRGVGKDIHPIEIAFMTNLFSFAFFLPWLIRTRFRPLRTTKIHTHWMRAVFNVFAVCGWYFALTITPLADAVALSLTGPLVATLGAVIFLGEPARVRRWIAMGIGVLGALLIIRPGFQSFIPGYWVVIFSLVCTAGSRLFTKHLTQSEAPAANGAWLALLQVPITFSLAIFVWHWPNPIQLAMMIAVGLIAGGAYYTLTVAYDRSDVGALEPFNFIRLIIAALIGYFIFSENIDVWTWIGGAVIVASTTYVAHREAVKRRN